MKIPVLGKNEMLVHLVYNYFKFLCDKVIGTDLKNQDIYYDVDHIGIKQFI